MYEVLCHVKQKVSKSDEIQKPHRLKNENLFEFLKYIFNYYVRIVR